MPSVEGSYYETRCLVTLLSSSKETVVLASENAYLASLHMVASWQFKDILAFPFELPIRQALSMD